MTDLIKLLPADQIWYAVLIYTLLVAAITLGLDMAFSSNQDKLIAKAISGTIKGLKKRGMLRK